MFARNRLWIRRNIFAQYRDNGQFIRVCSTQGNLEGTGKFNDQASLYVHWPYCAKRCTYCNFNKYINKHVDHERMTKCLTTELNYLIQASGVKEITSIFFGGGTPSLAKASTIKDIIDKVKNSVQFSDNAEISLEVNPTELESGKLRAFKDAGVNRVSLGIQALNDDDLRLLGREHTTNEALKCLEEAKSVFPGCASLDVIFGRPNQTVESWNKELDQVLSICDSHVSLYQLTVERGTQLFKWVEDKSVILPDNDVMADLYMAAVEKLESQGLRRYEVSNFARKGHESQHNLGYWSGMQYIGIGPGAHGRFIPKGLGLTHREWRVQTLEPEFWMREVEKNEHATRKRKPLFQKERLQELLITGLRMTDGITHETWNEVANDSLEKIFGHLIHSSDICDEGLFVLDERNNKLNYLHSFPTVYVLKASNYLTRTHTSLSKEDHRCIDFLKAYWRCISACGRHEVNENCFEEKQDMLECKYQHKSTARYNLMRREYLRQTGKEYNPDVPLAPMHIFPKETTARPKNADNLRGS